MTIFVLTAVSLIFSLKIKSVKAEETATWNWTVERPNPVWWRWDYEKEKPVRGGYIYYASQNYVGVMNPNHMPVNDWIAMVQIYEALNYKEGDYRPTFPFLAESFEFTAPLTCIVKTRKGIRFQDGAPFNAESVKYYMDWIMDKENGCWSRGWFEPVKSIEVLNEDTVKFNLEYPWAAMQGLMGTVPGYAISPKALKGDNALKDKKRLEQKVKYAAKKVEKEEKKLEKARQELAGLTCFKGLSNHFKDLPWSDPK